tara:strand:- start:453 stop:692 length:240 start_codon:yes stop_codon:yes gene_type:complete
MTMNKLAITENVEYKEVPVLKREYRIDIKVTPIEDGTDIIYGELSKTTFFTQDPYEDLADLNKAVTTIVDSIKQSNLYG